MFFFKIYNFLVYNGMKGSEHCTLRSRQRFWLISITIIRSFGDVTEWHNYFLQNLVGHRMITELNVYPLSYSLQPSCFELHDDMKILTIFIYWANLSAG